MTADGRGRTDVPVPDDAEFALCLTHDVDRPYKTYQSLYYAAKERDPSHLRSLVSDERPYWQFSEVMELEDDLGVRSSWYFLDEQRLFRDRPPREWLTPTGWQLYGGRYDLGDDEIRRVVRTLSHNGWEVGLHGSYESYRDVDRLRAEKRRLESILGEPVLGGRQHYLNLERPETWRRHSDVGLNYDATAGSPWEGEPSYGVFYPFDDEFAVFRTTLMDVSLLERHDDLESAWSTCERVLEEVREVGDVITVCWHPRYFNEAEFPGYREVYVRLLERALGMGAWVGPCGEFYKTALEEEESQAVSRDGALGGSQ